MRLEGISMSFPGSGIVSRFPNTSVTILRLTPVKIVLLKRRRLSQTTAQKTCWSSAEAILAASFKTTSLAVPRLRESKVKRCW